MIKTLLGIRLRSMLGSITSGKKRKGKEQVSKGKILLISLVYLYLIVVFGGLFTMLAVTMAPILVSSGLDWFYFAAFNIVAFAVVFIFSIFETKSELFECKDNELLLSMPIKPRDIILSRIFTVLVYNYLETALVLLPAIIVYIVFGGSALGITGSIIVLLVLPLLATALASGVGYLVALLSKKMKNNSLLTTLISLIFLTLYFLFYSAFMGSGDESVDFVALSRSFTGLKFFGEASMCHPLYTTLLVAVSLCVAALAYTLISRSYISIVTATGSGKKKKYKGAYLKKGSAFLAVVKKELSLFFSSATYMLNAGLGMVFTVVIGIMLLMNAGSISEFAALLFEIPIDGIDPNQIIAVLLAAALVLVCSMNTMSASALSLEGKRLWIIKTMPISARTVLFAKTMPAVLLPLLPNLFASVCIIIALKPDPLTSVTVVILPIIASIVCALLGTVFNAALPKFSYENEAQVVKQSLSVFLSMLVNTLLGFGYVAAAFLISVLLAMPLLAMGLLLLLSVMLSVAFAIVISGPLSRKYDELSL